MFNAGGALNDVHQVKVGMTNASLYAYVADGENGMRILQLTDPETMPTFAGFSPRPEPKLIATYKTKGPAIAISKGLDRDRAVDESGNQLAVFGRRGARPFNLAEMRSMYLLDGKLFTVSDTPNTTAQPLKAAANEAGSTDENGMAAALNSMLPLPRSGRAQVFVCAGIGLLFAAAGWRKIRRPRRH
jgi:hypothetical protein